jgi:hypothetical protein
LLARAGYHYALSIRPGIVGAKEDNDLLALPRIGVSHDCASNPSLLAWRIKGGLGT